MNRLRNVRGNWTRWVSDAVVNGGKGVKLSGFDPSQVKRRRSNEQTDRDSQFEYLNERTTVILCNGRTSDRYTPGSGGELR